MEKTANFLNNQRYIGSERIKRKIYLNYKYITNKTNQIYYSLFIIFFALLFLSKNQSLDVGAEILISMLIVILFIPIILLF